MTITLNYGVVFGKCDASDVFEWEVELDEKQEDGEDHAHRDDLQRRHAERGQLPARRHVGLMR